jgi:hypothetical protein
MHGERLRSSVRNFVICLIYFGLQSLAVPSLGDESVLPAYSLRENYEYTDQAFPDSRQGLTL